MGNFSVGDTVQLKSGGPIMTVGSVDEEGLSCVWFTDKGTEAFRGYFEQGTLQKVDL